MPAVGLAIFPLSMYGWSFPPHGDSTMNSRERFLTALRGEKPDRTPLANVAAMNPVELQTLTG